MKRLCLVSKYGDEVFFRISDVRGITYEFAKDIFSETVLSDKGLTSFEIMIVIHFNDEKSSSFGVLNWSMYFD